MPKVYKTPGVYSQEIDISEITVPAGTSTGGIVIRAPKGPINRMQRVTVDKGYIELFGEPVFTSGTSETITGLTQAADKEKIPEYGYGSYAALEFLKESSDLYVLRVANSGDAFANTVFQTSAAAVSAQTITANPSPTVLDTATAIADINAVSFTTISANPGVLMVASTGPGVEGNNIAVMVETYSSGCEWRFAYDDYNLVSSNSAPSASAIALKAIKVSVFQKKTNENWHSYASETDRRWWFDNMIAIESYIGTLTNQLDNNGRQMSLVEQVNGISKYIYLKVNALSSKVITGATTTVSADGNSRVLNLAIGQLTGGVVTPGTGINSVAGWSFFKDKENVDVSILIVPDWNMTVKTTINSEVISFRKDCIGCFQTGHFKNITVSDVLASETYGYVAPSYNALYAGWDLVFDKYNDRSVYLPKAIFGAVIMARTDNVAQVWKAPAGSGRGIIPALDQNKVWTFTEIGLLYERNINTSKLIRGTGHVMWGQKTAQMKASALDRVNVRRVLLYIEKTVDKLLQPYVLDINNTEKGRLRVWSNIDSFLANIKAEEGLIAYEVICNETNNTPLVIDQNRLAIDIYVQAPKTVEFIDVQTIVTKTGVNFQEVLVR